MSVAVAVVALAVSLSAAKTSNPHSRHKKSAVKASSKVQSSHHGRRSARSGHLRKAKARSRGQQVIDNDRAREIQEALIREKYLDGEPTGVWDQRTKDAMARYQEDNGWQTKSLPDARALIKLGLGPNHENVLNPQTAATNPPFSAVRMRAENPANQQ